MKRSTVGIKFRLIALGVILCLAGVLLRYFVALPRFQDHVQDLVVAQQRNVAGYVARDVGQRVRDRALLSARLGADLNRALLGQPAALDAWLDERQRINPLFNGGLLVLAPDGTPLGAVGPAAAGARAQRFAGASWLGAALAAPAPFMSRATAMAPDASAILFIAPLRDASGTAVALVCGVALLGQPGFVDNILADKAEADATSNLLLVSPAERLFIAASDPTMVLKPTPATGVNLLHDRAMTGYRGSGVTTNARGVEELSAIASVAGTDWFVVARIPAAQAFRAVDKIRMFMFQASLVWVTILLLILVFGLSHILRPLVSAARAIHDMAAGKRELGPLPVVRDDEVGELVSVFNVLVQRLHKEEAARRASEARLLHMAHHDSLTGLFNRSMLEDRIDQAIARCERSGLQMALMFCDLDGFKAINDAAGHRVGDAVLCQVAARLSGSRRRVDTVARLGGDEFVILLSDLDNARASADTVARQCLADLRVPFEVDGAEFSLGMSIGIVLHGGAGASSASLLSQADQAMYQAKRLGKGQFCFADQATSAAPI